VAAPPAPPPPARQEPPARIGPALVLFAVLLVALMNLGGLAGWNAGLLDGRLVDPDSYLRLLTILELREGAPWFEDVTPRLAAPEGLVNQWTRPLDLLVLLPALAIEALAGLPAREALVWSGILVSPLTHVAAILAAAWAAGIAWGGRAPWYAALVMAGTPAVATYSALGRPDHHGLIIALLTLGLGAALRAAMPGGRARDAALAGAAFGLATWSGPEALIVAVPALAAFGLAALLAEDGRALARRGLACSLGLAAACAIGIAAEHRPAAWLVAEYDRLSVHHLGLALLAGAVFAVAAAAGARPRPMRAALSGAAGLAAFAALLALFPGTLRGPLANADAAYLALFHPTIQENQPLPPFGPGDPWEAAIYIAGGAPLGLLALWLALPGWRRDGRWPAALVLALPLLAGLAATFGARRFGMDLAPPAAIAAAGLVGLVLQARRPRSEALRASLATLLFFGALAVPFLGLRAQEAPGSTAVRAEATARCDWTAMGRWLGAARPGVAPGAPAPVLIASDVFEGPELAWRTPYRVVATPHHRAGPAIEDTLGFFAATDPEAARAIAARRQVALVLACVARGAEAIPAGSLAALLRDGAPPPWLAPVALPPGLSGFRLLEVVR
jgi:4-amino-4-deoxy-L-arabinose transferase-like glycosyltransferase